jgi:hypothetical protein
MRHTTCTLAAVLFAAPALAADPPKLNELAGVPPGLEVDGAVERVHGFTDANGENVVVFSSRDTPRKDDAKTRELFVRHYATKAGEKPKQLRLVRDRVDDCPFDLTAKFDPRALGVTDLDGDGVGELTFAYTVGCRSDVSPLPLKLLVLENGEKYILRGETRVEHAPGEKAGGKEKPDPAAKKWPAGFLDHARAVWARVVDEKF